MVKTFRITEEKMKAFSSTTRLHILAFLKRKSGATVGEISEELGLTDGAVSQHLRFLKAANVVVSARRGMYTSYRLPLKRDSILVAVLQSL